MGIQPLLAKDTSGKSMPSRHAFFGDYFHVSTLLFLAADPICLLLSAGLGQCVIRSALSKVDVLVGYLLRHLLGSFYFFLL